MGFWSPKYVKIESTDTGAGYIVPLNELKDEDWVALFEGCTRAGDGYTVKAVDMTDEAYEQLPDFNGF